MKGKLVGLSKVACPFIALAILLLSHSAAVSQDVVVIRHSDGKKELKRKGQIDQWIGQTLTLKSDLGVRNIDNDKIIRVETKWSEDYQAGLQLMAANQFSPAIKRFQTALKSEQRPWAKNVIRAKIVHCATSIESYGLAATRFEEIVKHDPQTRFLNMAPIKWTSTAGSTNLGSLAKEWMDTNDPTLQLIGASWSTTGITKKQAVSKLEQLTKDFDPKIAGLAAAQLWKARGLSATEKQIDVWIKKLDQLPENLRAGPWFVIAEAQRRAKLNEKAAINFMRVPILYPEQRSLSAAALYQVAGLMHNTNRLSEEAILKNELKENFGDTIWAK